MAPLTDADAALVAAARVGPYFAWQPHTGDPAFRPLTELSDPTVLDTRVGAARRQLARLGGLDPSDLPDRVVASTVFLGLAARLLSAPLAAAALAGAVPVPDPARIHWRPVASGPLPISYETLAATTADLPAALADVVTTVVEPVLTAYRKRFVISEKVLWGNVASALGGAHTMITEAAPAHASRAAALIEAMLTRSPLAGTATLHRPDPTRDRWFLVRHNCCLYYRIPGGGTCGDCVLTDRRSRERHWRAVLDRSA